MRKNSGLSASILAAIAAAGLSDVVASPAERAATTGRRRQTAKPFLTAGAHSVPSSPNGGRGGKHRSNRQAQRAAAKRRNKARQT